MCRPVLPTMSRCSTLQKDNIGGQQQADQLEQIPTSSESHHPPQD